MVWVMEVLLTIYNPYQHMIRVIHHLVTVHKVWHRHHPVFGLLCLA